ncbi:MAG: phosphotransferase, partial [Alphaproteobacteria bacterium]|nr:phosphotransferase [Alphaproteobacteria bacterium]
VWRFNEVTVSRAAHSAGLSPQIRHHEPDVLVMDFVENGRALDEEAVRDADMLARIVALVRRCHAELPHHLEVPGPMFWVFNANRRYARMIEAAGGRLSDRLAELMALNDRLEAGVGPIRPVFCHNDLLAANLIEDGSRLWLIDWEYGGWNSALFDLANLATNNSLDDAQERRLLSLYCERPPEPALVARFRAMKAASLLREALWSRIAEMHSHLDFDYVAYTDEYLARFARVVAELEAPA